MPATPEALTPPDNPGDMETWLHAHEDRIAGQYRTELADIVKTAATAYANSLTAAGNPDAFDGYNAALVNLSKSTAEDITDLYQAGGLSAWISRAASGEPPLKVQKAWAAVVSDLAVTHLADTTNRITRATKDVWTDVQTRVEGSLRSGQSNVKLQAEIEKATGYSSSRAEMIARTETMNAFNGGIADGANTLPTEYRPTRKEWLATGDARTRPSHSAANGQVVGFDDTFSVGGVSMSRPGDRSAPSSEVVNCRCTMLLHYPGDELPDGTTAPDAGQFAATPELKAPEVPPTTVRPLPSSRPDPKEVAAQANQSYDDALSKGAESNGIVYKVKPSGGYGTDEMMNMTAQRHGVDGLPVQTTHADIDALVKDGWGEAYRGASVEGIESFTTGAYESGQGIFGNGFYSAIDNIDYLDVRSPSNMVDRVRANPMGSRQVDNATAQQIAQGYARSTGQVVRMAVDPQARVISLDAAEGLLFQAQEAGSKAMDIGQVALAAGWDAIAVGGGQYLNILNREVVRWALVH